MNSKVFDSISRKGMSLLVGDEVEASAHQLGVTVFNSKKQDIIFSTMLMELHQASS